MAANRISFLADDLNLAIDTTINYGIGQYFYVKYDTEKKEVSNGTDQDYASDKCMKLSISRIHYKKSIYKPGFVKLEMSIDNFSKATIRNKINSYVAALKLYFLSKNQNFCERTLSLFKREKTTTGEADTTYIQGYYITDLSIKQKIVNGDRITYVILTAYSPDHFLTLNKYSKVYRGKPLSTIIKSTLKDTFKGNNLILADRFYAKNLCHTTDQTGNELKQPYLVQYNESFHDFVVRTANRCGEMFYYEDGKLILGVDESNLDIKDSGKTKDIKPDVISDTLPEEITISTIPTAFQKEVESLNKSYLIGSTNEMETAAKGKLYCNRNIEYNDALYQTDIDKDSLTYGDVTEAHWLEVAGKILSSSGLTGAITGGVNKATDIAISAGMIVNGKTISEKKNKIKIQDCEKQLNNNFHSPTTTFKKEDDAIRDFKQAYQTNHPDEFTIEKTVNNDPFKEPNSKASKELAKFIKKAIEANDPSNPDGIYGRNFTEKVKAKLKKDYKATHADEFVIKSPKTDEAIFKAGTQADKDIQQYIVDHTTSVTQQEVNDFKRNYEKEHDDFKGRSISEKSNLWSDPTKPHHLALEEFVKKGHGPSDAEIAEAKKRWKDEHPEDCVDVTKMTDSAIDAKLETMVNDPNTTVGSQFKAYKSSKGDDYDKIFKMEKEIEAEDGAKTYFTNKHLSEDKEKDDEWYKSLTNPKDANCNFPYNRLVEKFKTEYRNSHKDECTKKIFVPTTDYDKVWKNKNSSPAKALKVFLANRLDESNFSHRYYSWIEASEELATSSVQVHQLNNDKIPTYKIGQYCKLTSDLEAPVYLINQIEVDIYSDTSTSMHKIDASMTISQTTYNGGRSETYGYQKNTFPPLADIPHIRKAEPQLAKITNVADPQRAGRVQFIYPWMTTESAKDDKGEAIKDLKDEPAKADNSPWVPVLVPFTGGKDSGFLMTPDKDDLVMVNYEGGNVERPYIDGSVFCGKGGTNWGSVPLIAKALNFRNSKHAITYKGNGITFVPGSADAFIASMLPSCLGMPLMKYWGKGNVSDDMRFGGGMVFTDHYGTYNISMNSASRSIDIQSPYGNVNLNAFTGITISAPNGDIKISGKNVTIEAGNKVEITSGKNIKGTKKTPANEVIGAIGNMIGSAAGSAGLKGALKSATGLDLGKLLDLSFVRNVWEIIFRPVDGSLKVASRRNLVMTAGEGKATIPASTLSDAAVPKKLASLNPKKLLMNAFKGATGTDSEYETAAIASESDIFNVMELYTSKADEEIKRFMDCRKSVLDTINVDYSREPVKDELKTAKGIQDLLLKSSEIQDTDVFKDPDSVLDLQALRLVKFFENARNILLAITDNGKLATILTEKLTNEYKPYGTDNVGKFKGLKKGDIDTAKVITQIYGAEDTLAGRLEKLLNNNFSIDKASIQLRLNIIIAIAAKSKLFKKKDGENWVRFNSTDAIDLGNKDVNATAKFIQENYKYDPKDDSSETAKGWETFGSALLGGMGLGDYASYNDEKDEWTFMSNLKKTFNINGEAGPRSIWDASSNKGKVIISQDKKSYSLENGNWTATESGALTLEALTKNVLNKKNS